MKILTLSWLSSFRRWCKLNVDPCYLQHILRVSHISQRGTKQGDLNKAEEASRSAHLIQTGLFTAVCCCSTADFPTAEKTSLRRDNNHNWNQKTLKYLCVCSNSTTFRITVGLITESYVLPLVVCFVWGRGMSCAAQSPGMAPEGLLPPTFTEGGVASGLPLSGRMTRAQAGPGMMELKLFNILALHTGRREKHRKAKLIFSSHHVLKEQL